jgi:hypothetical protein
MDRVCTPGRDGDKKVAELLILLLEAVGVFNLAAPRAAWYAEWGWRIKDAEPSDRALVAHRISGVFALVVAVLMLVL